jgi:putative hemolysin
MKHKKMQKTQRAKTSDKILFAIAILAIILTAAAIATNAGPVKTGHETAVEIANPASVYCIDRGGKLSIVDGPDGQYGICTLPGGKQCEEWKYFRGEC